ncbi:MAG: hypothetical protein JZU65_00865, partial [Chlorobium sp.]|nr:hypothetical protein [Chlorobium sp.]
MNGLKGWGAALLSTILVTLPVGTFFWALTPAYADKNVDYRALPPFMSTYVKPNVLFILDNSNSMDEDVDGAAVGSNAANSKSEIARNAMKIIIANNKDSMRFGLMAYRQTGVQLYHLHNSPYYASYDPATYKPAADPNALDPTYGNMPIYKSPNINTKRSLNPTDPGRYIYYDTALPYYSSSNQGNAFCYSSNFTIPDPGTCREGNTASCHSYWCYRTKNGVLATPAGRTKTQLGNTYGYASNFTDPIFYPTDSDIAAGFHEFGLENAWTYVGRTWFSNSSPGQGMLHKAIGDSTTAQLTALNNLLGTSQFAATTDIPLRNAGLTPLAGAIESAREYFSNVLPATEATATVVRTTPVQYECQKNFVVLVTDGLPSVNKAGQIGTTNDLITELKAEIVKLRNVTVPNFTDPFDVKTYVIGFAIPPQLGDKLDELAVAGGTDVAGKALLAHDANDLAAKLEAVFLQINRQVSSGAAASVISNTRSGQGVVYQSVFYPQYTDGTVQHNSVDWAGSVHALFVDNYGNLREDTNHNNQLDVGNEKCQKFSPDIPAWCNNNLQDTEDLDGDGRLDLVDEDQQVIAAYPAWKGNNGLDTEDVDGDGHLDINEDNQVIAGHPLWPNNGQLDTEDLDSDGVLDIEEDDQNIAGHSNWKDNGLLDTEDVDGDGHIDIVEDGNGDGFFQTEDADQDGHLDINEDKDGDGKLDTVNEDLDGDTHLDTVNEDQQNIAGYPAWQGNGALDTEDLDGDGHFDVINEDLQVFAAHASWKSNGNLDTEDINHNGILDAGEDTPSEIDGSFNGVLDTEDIDNDGRLDTINEDINGNSTLDTEDLDGDGHLDIIDEDIDHDGHLDVNEDVDGDGRLDIDEDQQDIAGYPAWKDNGTLDTEDLDGDHKPDVNEDTNGNLLTETEDTDGDGKLSSSEDTNGNGALDTEDTDKDGKLDTVNEDTNGNGVLETEDIDLDGHLDKAEDLNGNAILDVENDFNNDGKLDDSDLIVVYSEDANGNTIVQKYFDANGNGTVDIEDEVKFDPPIPAWVGNGILNTEDTNHNNKLDASEDINGNGKLDTEDLNGNGLLNTEQLAGSWTLQQVNYLWQSGSWLNEMSNLNVVDQRTYASNDQKRHIFTFIDSDKDQVVDAGELVDFTEANWGTLYHYLNLYPTFADEPAWTGAIRSNAANWTNFLEKQSKREINYIRGLDQAAFTSTTVPSYTLPAMRSRQVDYDDDGVVETWRLGDVIYSSPTLVGKPSEGYHLLYRDTTYGEFAAKHQNRRQVVYVGGNDGMLHAFNGGFYNDLIKGISTTSQKQPDTYKDTNGNKKWDLGETLTQDWNGNGAYDSGKGTEIEHVVGAELWAYIPKNLMPHLYWLTESTYQHVYYMDLKPRVFDARIFFNPDGTALDADHPNGWGTVMVAGMRFGGGEVKVDYAKDGDAYDTNDGDHTVKSAYVIMDITNPEAPPRVMAELTF